MVLNCGVAVMSQNYTDVCGRYGNERCCDGGECDGEWWCWAVVQLVW